MRGASARRQDGGSVTHVPPLSPDTERARADGRHLQEARRARRDRHRQAGGGASGGEEGGEQEGGGIGEHRAVLRANDYRAARQVPRVRLRLLCQQLRLPQGAQGGFRSFLQQGGGEELVRGAPELFLRQPAQEGVIGEAQRRGDRGHPREGGQTPRIHLGQGSLCRVLPQAPREAPPLRPIRERRPRALHPHQAQAPVRSAVHLAPRGHGDGPPARARLAAGVRDVDRRERRAKAKGGPDGHRPHHRLLAHVQVRGPSSARGDGSGRRGVQVVLRGEDETPQADVDLRPRHVPRRRPLRLKAHRACRLDAASRLPRSLQQLRLAYLHRD
mmetsp:Transcript_20780/g.67297  ORF Transcript_20780/g.67297 Transcript_20780/m.67297 type:complete len:330 (+) Transcript_20780:859-1848(+)